MAIESQNFQPLVMTLRSTLLVEKRGRAVRKKVIKCFKSKKVGHYSYECDEDKTLKTSNKKASNFLVHNDEPQESSSEEDTDPTSSQDDLEAVQKEVESED